MSTDKLADTISNDDAYMDDHSALAADRVRDRFVVIDRNDLPEVKPSSDGYGAWAGGTFFRPDQEKELRSTAHQYLAMAEHLRAHPPVDEKAVASMAEAIAADPAWGEDGNPATIARRLVADGWKREVTS